MVTVSGFISSDDGYSWNSTDVSQPFLPRQQGIGIACAINSPWVIRSNGTGSTLNGVAWVNNQFIAYGTGNLYISSNGMTWTSRLSGISNQFNSLTASGTYYIAGSNSGIILNSVDSITWNQVSLGTIENFKGVCWSASLGKSVAVGTGGILAISVDSVVWSLVSSHTSYDLNCIVWNGTVFLVVGNNGIISSSTDGLTWSSYGNGITTANLYGICWTGTQFVAVGANGTAISSIDGFNWKAFATGITTDLLSVTWGQTEVIAVGLNDVVIRSKDGLTWVQDDTRFVSPLYGIAYSSPFNIFIAVGTSGLIISSSSENVTTIITTISDSGYISSSYDGIIWSNGSIIFGNFGPRAILHSANQYGNNSTFMLVGSQKYANNEPCYNMFDEVAQIFRSDSDVIDNSGFENSWDMMYSEEPNSIFHGVLRSNRLPAEVSTVPTQSGTSTNQVTVDKASNPFLAGLVGLFTDNPSMIFGTVTFSTNIDEVFNLIGVVDNGSTWTFTYQGTATFAITDIATFDWIYSDAWIVCGGSNGNPILVYSLDDGFSWNRVTLPEAFNNNQFFDITYANETFYISANGYIVNTASLINPVWSGTDYVIANYASPDFTKIESNPSGHIVAVSSGLIYYSLDGAVWHKFEAPGYQFISVIWYIDHWVVGVRSLLTTYTYFTSTDTINWVGQNNGIQMYDFAILP